MNIGVKANRLLIPFILQYISNKNKDEAAKRVLNPHKKITKNDVTATKIYFFLFVSSHLLKANIMPNEHIFCPYKRSLTSVPYSVSASGNIAIPYGYNKY